MKPIRLYLPATVGEAARSQDYIRQLPVQWRVTIVCMADHDLRSSLDSKVQFVSEGPPTVTAWVIAGGRRGERCIFGNFRRPPEHLIKLAEAWEATGCKVASACDAKYPLDPSCWGVVSDFLGVASRAAQHKAREILRCSRAPREWECLEADLLRDVVWLRLKPWGCCLVDMPRATKCPQCGDSVVQCRHTGDYCEECGWPDESRPEEDSSYQI